MKGDYKNSRIYKIQPICDHEENEVYYGSTVQLLCKRMAKHRDKYKRWKKGNHHKLTVFNLFDKYGLENCKIYLVENYPCDSKEKLEAREGYYIKNNACVNKNVAGRTRKEYNADNKDKIAEKTKKYYTENKLNISKKKELYYNRKKDEISEKLKIKYNCGCGSCLRYSDKKRHNKSLKHKKYQKKIDQLAALNKMHNEIIQKHKKLYLL